MSKNAENRVGFVAADCARTWHHQGTAGRLASRPGIRPRIYAQVAGHEAIVAMVSLGLGVGIAPQLVIESSGLGEGVETVDIENGLPSLSIGLAALRQRLSSPLVKSLWDVAGQTYPGSV